MSLNKQLYNLPLDSLEELLGCDLPGSTEFGAQNEMDTE